MSEPATQQQENDAPEMESRLSNLKGQEIEFLVARCKTAVGNLKQSEKERQAINDTMQAEREQLEALGITKKALALAINVSKMDDDQLDGFWLALQILLKAIEKPIKADDMQADLFE